MMFRARYTFANYDLIYHTSTLKTIITHIYICREWHFRICAKYWKFLNHHFHIFTQFDALKTIIWIYPNYYLRIDMNVVWGIKYRCVYPFSCTKALVRKEQLLHLWFNLLSGCFWALFTHWETSWNSICKKPPLFIGDVVLKLAYIIVVLL